MIISVKIGDLNPKMDEIIFILAAAKNCTSYFSDTPFGPDYYTSSKASITAPCIFKIFLIFANFFTFFKTDVFYKKKRII